MKKNLLISIATALVLVLSLLVMGCPDAEAAVVTLRLATPFQAGHSSGLGLELYAKRVEEATKGRVTFKIFWNDTLVPTQDALNALNTGIADIAKMVYSMEQAPWQVFPQMAGIFTDKEMESAARAMYKVSMSGKIKEQWAKLGVKPIYAWTLSNYQIATSKKPVKSLADLQGLKIRTSGGVLAQNVKALGAVPVSMTTADLFDALAKGVVDGASLSVPSYRRVPFFEVLNHYNFDFNLGGYPQYDCISLKAWNKISPEDQVIMETVGKEVCVQAAADNWGMALKDISEFPSLRKTIYTLSAQDKATVKSKLAPVREEWLSSMDAKGHSWVRDVLKDFEKALAELR